jgi:ABC-type glycerol-3-phosphate transport system substrate-binding protein
MPYYKSKFKRKYKRKYRPNFRAMVQKAIAKNLETKFLLKEYNAVSIQDSGRTPITGLLTDVAQGLTQQGRVGNTINVTGMYGQFQVAGADTTNIVRFVIYIPRDVDDEIGVNTYELIDTDRFTVLTDRIVTTTSNGPNIKQFKLVKNFHRGSKKGIQVQFSGSASTDGTFNRIKLYCVSDSSAVSDPALSGNLRVYYKDA